MPDPSTGLRGSLSPAQTTPAIPAATSRMITIDTTNVNSILVYPLSSHAMDQLPAILSKSASRPAGMPNQTLPPSLISADPQELFTFPCGNAGSTPTGSSAWRTLRKVHSLLATKLMGVVMAIVMICAQYSRECSPDCSWKNEEDR